MELGLVEFCFVVVVCVVVWVVVWCWVEGGDCGVGGLVVGGCLVVVVVDLCVGCFGVVLSVVVSLCICFWLVIGVLCGVFI